MSDFLKGSYKWTKISGEISAISSRFDHTLVKLDEDNLLVFGGVSEGWVQQNDLWKFTLSSGRWEEVKVEGNSKPATRKDHTAVILDGKMYVFGGQVGKDAANDLWIFDTVKREWTEFAGGVKPTRRSGHSAILSDKKMYVFGGICDGTELGDLWLFDAEKGSWEHLPDASSVHIDPRLYHSAALWDNHMVIFGGFKHQKPLHGVWSLDLATLQWIKVEVAPLRQRSGHAASFSDGLLYIFGGEAGNKDQGYDSLNDTSIYHLKEKRWDIVKTDATPKGRLGGKGVVIKDQFVIFGGVYVCGKEWDPSSWLNDVWALSRNS